MHYLSDHMIRPGVWLHRGREVPIVPKEELEDKAYYKGRCRNATYAMWDATKNCFVYWRQKFSMRFIETIKHPADDDGYDLFLTNEKVPEDQVPEEARLRVKP